MTIFHQQVELYRRLIHLSNQLFLLSTGCYHMLTSTLATQGEKSMKPLFHLDTETLLLPMENSAQVYSVLMLLNPSDLYTS